jgi:hypothetical protein
MKKASIINLVGTSKVHISGHRPDILTNIFLGFPQYLHVNSGIVP